MMIKREFCNAEKAVQVLMRIFLTYALLTLNPIESHIISYLLLSVAVLGYGLIISQSCRHWDLDA